VIANYSRLVVDLNRGEDSPECMRDISDHAPIPGNKNLSSGDKKLRIRHIFKPYHREIEKRLNAVLERDQVPLLLSIHSFTPVMDGYRRPWHIGVLWNREGRLGKKLVQQIRRNNPELVVGENEPYSLKSRNLAKNTISTHAESQGLPYIILEFRQDLVNTKAKAEKWAKIALQALEPILKNPKTYRRRKK
jgi:predicted N-formylglutamate amidohydrolase